MRESEERTVGPITQILRRVTSGEMDAVDALFRTIYADLHQIARERMRRQERSHSLQASDLVDECYLKLFHHPGLEVHNHRHLFALASRAMRSVLVDHARAKNSQKRMPQGERVSLDDLTVGRGEKSIDIVALDEALERLGKVAPQLAQIVELRFFGGLTMPEIGRQLDLPLRRTERDWSLARAWLKRALE